MFSDLMVTEPVPRNDESKKFKGLHKTFKIYSFLLAAGLMYPNPKNDRKRSLLLVIVMISYTPALTFMINDMYQRYKQSDLENFIRQTSVVIALIFVTLKQVLSIIKRRELKEIIDTINEDYEIFNYLPVEYQEIAEKTIIRAKRFEKVWIFILGSAVFSFPIMAGCFMVYSQLVEDNPKRYMVHETLLPGALAKFTYETPFFELYFVYTNYINLVLFQGYTGYDGIFSVCIFHAVIKLDMLNHCLQNMLADVSDPKEMKRKIANFVQAHCQIYKFIEDVENTFGVWLGLIFIISLAQIVLTLVPTTIEDADTNATYYLFATCTTVQLYIPCYLTSEITSKAAEIGDSAYSSKWENIPDSSLRRSLTIIIARAQIPLYFKALNLFTFNMEMFASVLRTAYSLFTLLKK